MISQLSAKYQFGMIHKADTTDGKVTNGAILTHDHARPRATLNDHALTATHDHARPSVPALLEVVHVVPPCERLNTRLMPISQQPDVMNCSHRC